MKIFGFPTFNVTKVLFTAEELNLDYEFQLLNLMEGEQRSPEHLARHPLGKVPVLEINGQYLIESAAICRFLAEENGNRLYGDTPLKHAAVNSWIDLMGFHIGRWMGVFFFEEVIKPYIPNSVRNQAQMDEAAGFLAEQLPFMDRTLAENPFLTGEDITIADTIAFAYCQTHQYTSVVLDEYPHIMNWYQSIDSRPSIARAMTRLPGGALVQPRS
ncbi:MAG: glutathione S-transferase family protein [Pseudomonadales bacterium]|nr:glutathione S-transferase family protein [Pseudomonadales bacterium]MCP5172028.1 glutathione S-transferase family protein [Pseudomonadales bacterium]